jgi:hypothetical protein
LWIYTKGEKADWNQINNCQSADNQSKLGNQKLSFLPLGFNIYYHSDSSILKMNGKPNMETTMAIVDIDKTCI